MKLLSIMTLCSMLLFQSTNDQTDSVESIITNQGYPIMETVDMDVCSTSAVKTYMSYTSVTNKDTKQYKLIHEELTVSEETGLLTDENGFIAAALGSYFGAIGERYLFTLENGEVLPIIKADAKSDAHTFDGCAQQYDKSVIEFVVDIEIAGEFFGVANNGLVLSGNFNNSDFFDGKIEEIEHVTIVEPTESEVKTESVEVPLVNVLT